MRFGLVDSSQSERSSQGREFPVRGPGCLGKNTILDLVLEIRAYVGFHWLRCARSTWVQYVSQTEVLLRYAGFSKLQ